jgi:apolipoprotein N-acyltransferase
MLSVDQERFAGWLLHFPNGWRSLLLAAGSAMVLYWAVPPERWSWLAWIALVPVLAAIAAAATAKQAFVYGWLFGTLLAALGMPWLEPAMQRYGGLPSPLSMALYALVVGQTGLVWALFAPLVWQLRRRAPTVPAAVVVPVFLCGVEFLVPTLFDWNLGFTQAGYPWITQVADFGGVPAVSFLVAMVNGSLFDVVDAGWRRRALPWRSAACTLSLMAAAAGYAQWRIAEIDLARAAAPKLKIGVVQGNLGLADANDVALAESHLQRFLAKSRQLQARGAELILWPETAYPFPVLRGSPSEAPTVVLPRLAQQLDVPVLLGVNTMASLAGSATVYNSAVLLAPDGQSVGIYDKHLLFPFGEYIPLASLFPMLKEWFPRPSYTSGIHRTPLVWGPSRIGALICMEDRFPDFVRGLAALRPNLLVALGSDARFGAAAAPQQHQALAVFRSIEMRLDLVRASFNGVSAIIDAAGRVTVQTRAVDPDALPGVKAFGLTGSVALLEGPRSFYARYGDVFAWLNVWVGLGLLLASRRR